MTSPSIINEYQVANSSVAMIGSVGKIVQLDVGGSGMRRISKASRDPDFCAQGKETPFICATVSAVVLVAVCKVILGSFFLKFLK